MTDPVRPVAPDDDRFTFTRAQLEAIFSGGWRAAKDGTHSYQTAWSIMQNAPMFDGLAAAPVPCAASPADPWQPIETAPKDGRNVLGWLNTTHPPMPIIVFWTGERWSNGDRSVGLPITHWMPLPIPPRATGEGARDEQAPTIQSEAPSQSEAAPPLVEPRHRTGTGQSGALQADTRHTDAPVAVSLDPHRLLTDAEINFLLAHTRQLLENAHHHGERVETCEAPACVKFRDIRARLRGEATVRVAQVDLPAEAAKVLRDNAWDLMTDDKPATVRVEE